MILETITVRFSKRLNSQLFLWTKEQFVFISKYYIILHSEYVYSQAVILSNAINNTL